MNLERAVEVLLERGALDVRGAKAELARLFGVEPQKVYELVLHARRNRWLSQFER